jgi:hypothetical protein
LVSEIRRRTQTEGTSEQGAEENIWAQDEIMRLEKIS